MAAVQPTIKNADMTEEMQQEAVEFAVQAFSLYTVEKDIAAYLKKAFDKKYGATWHCIVGRNFGSYVTHGKTTKIQFSTMSTPHTHAVLGVQSRSLFKLLIPALLSITTALETKHFIYFYVDKIAILLFKSG